MAEHNDDLDATVIDDLTEEIHAFPRTEEELETPESTDDAVAADDEDAEL